jgi:hypothetical protein
MSTRTPARRRRLPSPCGIAIAVALVAAPATAGDLPPPVVAAFTRGVQPLLLNRCAAGACHGGPEAAPRFRRPPGDSAPDGGTTHANLREFLAAVGPDLDPRRLVSLLAVRHPANDTPRRLTAAPLSARERITIETWLAAVRDAERPHRVDPAVVPVNAELPAPPPPPPNRFRALLDAAANPPALPPPEQPKGVVFKNDDPPAE